MEPLSFEEIVKAVRGNLFCTNKNVQIRGISTDSRNIQPGDLFFALKGKRFDGHQFIIRIIDAGAAGAVISNACVVNAGNKHFPVIRVPDTTIALGDLAQYYRQKLPARVIGITGSNGKTTTKEMTYRLLSHFGSTVRSQKSYNNCIGVPLTIFEIENRHQYGILEMGTNAPGEIKRLSEIGIPDIAVIVNISKTHLEGLDGIEGVAFAKAEILENIQTHGTFVYNTDNPWCVKIANGFNGNMVGFGFNPRADIQCTGVKKRDKGYSLIMNGCVEVLLPVPGYHNINNCLASFAVCHALGHDIRDVKDALSSFELPSMRIEQLRIGNVTVINDAYNANPESVSAALQYLSETETGGRRVFICGDMLELGKESQQLHREIGEKVARLNIDLLWTVGEYAHEIAEGARLSGMPERHITRFKNIGDVSVSEICSLREYSTVLIKGSRSVHMEHIIERLYEFLSYG
ncbi:MAG: UDP-N-acetylmuramoyl-tripeptide--D-alanyl-D-alanine ligase [wastewater metagenome]|nr:UDP-N-acetylmuramoyl-tripeptide--D-alanyl-D-alanine ligase [Candidatus Loosdrechtia aerotolerans]